MKGDIVRLGLSLWLRCLLWSVKKSPLVMECMVYMIDRHQSKYPPLTMRQQFIAREVGAYLVPLDK